MRRNPIKLGDGDELLAGTNHLSFIDRTYEIKGNTKHWQFVTRRTGVNAVMIVATIGDNIIITREYRAPLGGYEWGFPAGLIDDGESVEDAAYREIKEETGFSLFGINRVSPFVYNSAGLTDEAIAIVYCEARGGVGEPDLQDSEDITTYVATRAEVSDLLKDSSAMISAKAWIILERFAREGKV